MPPIRGHSKTFVLFDPSNEDDDDDDFGMPPLIDNPFAFTSSSESEAADPSPHPIARKFTFEHDLIKGNHTKNDVEAVPFEQVQTITFAPPYIPPSRLSQAVKMTSKEESDLPPLVEPLTLNENEREDSDGNFSSSHSFAAELETSALQRREINESSYIPRPPNAFILFRSSFIKAHKDSGGRSGSKTLAKTISLAWRNLPPEERAEWEAKALVAQAEHRQRYPDWRFNHATGDGKRRIKKVKDGPQRSHRKSVSTIADLPNNAAKVKETDNEEKSIPQPAKNEAKMVCNPSPSRPISKQEQRIDAQFSLASPQQTVQGWPDFNFLSDTPRVNTGARSADTASTALRTNAPVSSMAFPGNFPPVPQIRRATLLSSGLTDIVTSALPDSILDAQPSGASDADAASPPPTSPFLGSDSALSSPESPFVVSFEPFLSYPDVDNAGVYSMPTDQSHPSLLQFAMPNLASTRRPSPAAVVASMYRQSIAGRQNSISGGGSLSHGSSPIASNIPSETEELNSLEGIKSSNLKRSLSAPAPHDRLRPLAHHVVAPEGNGAAQARTSAQPRSNLSFSLTAHSVGHTIEPVRSSISEGNESTQIPYIPSSPTKRGRFKAPTHMSSSSSAVRGPRRLLPQSRRESFSGFTPSQMLLPVLPASLPLNDGSLDDTYDQLTSSIRPTLPSGLDAGSMPHSWPPASPLLLPLRPHHQLFQSPTTVAHAQSTMYPLSNLQTQQIPRGNTDPYLHNPSFLPEPSSTSMHFSFGFATSSSFSSLANWAGGSTEGNT